MSTGHPANCTECVPCPECGDAAWCKSEIAPHPCSHHGDWCEDHTQERCILCRLEAEAEMHQSGRYDPRADPFFDHTAPEPVDRIARDGGYHWDGGWVDMPKEEGA